MKKNYLKFTMCTIIFLFVILLNVNIKAFASPVTKAKYTMKTDTVEIKADNGEVRGIVYFQYPEIQGTSSEVQSINDILKKESKTYMQSETAQNLIDCAKQYAKNVTDKAEEVITYYYKTDCVVTYNQNSMISLHMKNAWYAGGVYNQYDYGYTFDLGTGKKLEIKDVVSGSSVSVKNKILTAGKKYLTSDEGFDQKAYRVIKSNYLKDFKFYLEKGKVYICYGSYELGRGNGWDTFSIKSKY